MAGLSIRVRVHSHGMEGPGRLPVRFIPLSACPPFERKRPHLGAQSSDARARCSLEVGHKATQAGILIGEQTDQIVCLNRILGAN